MHIKERFNNPSVEEMSNRVQRLQDAMTKHGISAYVAVDPANVLWLTNFANFIHERPFILIVPQKGAPRFLVPFLELDHVIHRIVGNVDIVTYPEFPAPMGERWQDRLIETLPTEGDLAGELMLPSAIASACGNPIRFIELMEPLRAVKSDYELGRIAYGCRLMSEAHRGLLENARPGMSQSEINRTIGKAITDRLVADNPSINPFSTKVLTLIQSPQVSHDPHNFTDLDMKMEDEGPHVTVFNAVLNGYGAEIERTFFLRSAPEKAKAPFETMMEARRLTFDLIRPGNVLSEIDARVNRLFEDRGYAGARRHRAGHGIGVTSHEGPFIAEGDETEIRSGMVFTIEPGIYLPGIGGFRHSDTVVVTRDGVECLTTAPDELQDLTL